MKVEKDPEEIVRKAVERITTGEIKDKKSLWKELDEIEDLTTEKKTKMLNFYLQLEGYDTFNKLFRKEKLQQVDIDW